MKRVLVLLSFYNGKKHIKQQIESILEQKDVSVDILIRDDGSTDDSVAFIRSLADNEPRIRIMRGKNVGYKRSFMRMVYQCDATYDYYAFADQDDVWLPEKMKAAVDKLSLYENEPALYYGYMTQVYEDLRKMEEQQHFHKVPDKKLILFQNFTQGSTIVFNRRLLELAREYLLRKDISHDVWLPFLARFTGKVVGDPVSYILYRRYDDSVTVQQKKSYVYNLFRQIFSHEKVENLSIDLLKGYANRLETTDRKLLETVAGYRKKGNKRAVIMDRGIRRYTPKGTLMLKAALLLNRVE